MEECKLYLLYSREKTLSGKPHICVKYRLHVTTLCMADESLALKLRLYFAVLWIKQIEYWSFVVTNGYGHTEKAGSSVQNSTPTYKSAHDFVSRVDDMSGLISPLREEVFDITSQDPNLTNYPQDPSLMGTTLSSSVDTMGSYCDGDQCFHFIYFIKFFVKNEKEMSFVFSCIQNI